MIPSAVGWGIRLMLRILCRPGFCRSVPGIRYQARKEPKSGCAALLPSLRHHYGCQSVLVLFSSSGFNDLTPRRGCSIDNRHTYTSPTTVLRLQQTTRRTQTVPYGLINFFVRDTGLGCITRSDLFKTGGYPSCKPHGFA